MWSFGREAPVVCGVCVSVCGDCLGDPVSVEVCQDQRSRNATTTIPLLYPRLSICPFDFSPLQSFWGLLLNTQTESVLFLPLCGGGGGEKMERATAIKQSSKVGAEPQSTYTVTAAPAPPPGPMNSVSFFCFCWFLLMEKEEKTKARRQGLRRPECFSFPEDCSAWMSKQWDVTCAGQPSVSVLWVFYAFPFLILENLFFLLYSCENIWIIVVFWLFSWYVPPFPF